MPAVLKDAHFLIGVAVGFWLLVAAAYAADPGFIEGLVMYYLDLLTS
jgi:hypothetical protein